VELLALIPRSRSVAWTWLREAMDLKLLHQGRDGRWQIDPPQDYGQLVVFPDTLCTPAEVTLHCFMARWFHGDDSQVISYEVMSDLAGVSRRTAIRYCDRLAGLGWLTIQGIFAMTAADDDYEGRQTLTGIHRAPNLYRYRLRGVFRRRKTGRVTGSHPLDLLAQDLEDRLRLKNPFAVPARIYYWDHEITPTVLDHVAKAIPGCRRYTYVLVPNRTILFGDSVYLWAYRLAHGKSYRRFGASIGCPVSVTLLNPEGTPEIRTDLGGGGSGGVFGYHGSHGVHEFLDPLIL
jgi:hypothetical protein